MSFGIWVSTFLIKCIIKVKPQCKPLRRVEVWLHSVLTTISGGREWLSLRPLYPREKKFRISLNKRLGGIHDRVVRFGEVKNLLSFPRIEIRIVLPVA